MHNVTESFSLNICKTLRHNKRCKYACTHAVCFIYLCLVFFPCNVLIKFALNCCSSYYSINRAMVQRRVKKYSLKHIEYVSMRYKWNMFVLKDLSAVIMICQPSYNDFTRWKYLNDRKYKWLVSIISQINAVSS